MPLTRRSFLKIITVCTGVLLSGGTAFYRLFSQKARRLHKAQYFDTLCPLCTMHCDMRVYYKGDTVLTVQGIKKSPINRGMLCAKGTLAGELLMSGKDLSPLYKAAGHSKASKTRYDTIVEKAAENLKLSRDATFKTSAQGISYNATDKIAALAGSSLSNEDAYLVNKFCRTLGVSELGTEAHLSGFGALKGLSATFGTSAGHNPLHDLQNSNVIMIIGANPVRRNSVMLRYICTAKKKGAKVIVVDPEINEVSRLADVHVQLRPGTDMILLSGILYYCFKNRMYNKDYIVKNSDASFLVSDSFNFSHESGLFSGYSQKSASYEDVSSWSYIIDERGNPKTDPNLKRPNSVFQILNTIFSGYTPDQVLNSTGCSADVLLAAAQIFGSSSRKGEAASVIVGGGFLESTGSQGMRLLSILQLMCGNIGVSGGGIVRGWLKQNAQGVLDAVSDWNMLPGSLPLPDIRKSESDYELYIKNNSQTSNDFASINLYKNFESYFSSQMKAWFLNTDARKAFHFLPKADSSFSAAKFSRKMDEEFYEGLLLFDIDLYTTKLSRDVLINGLKNIKWIILFYKNEKSIKELMALLPEENSIELMLFPILSPLEIGGSYTSSDRVIKPLRGRSLMSQHSSKQAYTILQDIMTKLSERYSAEKGVSAAPILSSKWNYNSYSEIRTEINGFADSSDGEKKMIDSFYKLENPEIICGNWLLAGSFADIDSEKRNKIPKINDNQLLHSTWNKSWPLNSRFLFNRCEQVKGKNISIDRSVIKAGDTLIYPDNKKARPFYFNKEGVAYFLSRSIASGPLPLVPLKLLSNSAASHESSELVLYNSDEYESMITSLFASYAEVYGEEAIILNRRSAKQFNINNNDSVAVKRGEKTVFLQAFVSDRVFNAGLYAKVSGSVCREIFDSFIEAPEQIRALPEVKIERVV